MKIGIDISQLAFPATGVANFVKELTNQLINKDHENEYILFYSSLRKNFQSSMINIQPSSKNVIIKTFKIPPTLLDVLWNKLHIFPIENFIGPIDIFITSDWTEPPVKKAKKTTILYDLVVYKYPEETAKKIVEVQKRKLRWVKKETSMVFCISEATKRDAKNILGIPESKLTVVYPGI